MRRSDILGRFVRGGAAGMAALVFAASAAEAALPTGGMLLPRPRGPARADLPSATAIAVFRIPSATAYGIAGGGVGGEDAAVFANETPTETIPEGAGEAKESAPLITPRTASAESNPFAPPAPEETDAVSAADPFAPAPIGEDPTPPAEAAAGGFTAAEAPPVPITTEPVSVEPEVAEFAGLKGVCPVTLRDERRSVTPNPELVSLHAGRRYEFATAEAKAEFDADPDRYAPALGGRDVVLTAHGAEDAVGSLKFAGYYHGRLYLFQSDETYRAFYENPKRYGVGE
jgi:YHS domain-containing protein